MFFLQWLKEDFLPVKSSFEPNTKIALLWRHVLKKQMVESADRRFPPAQQKGVQTTTTTSRRTTSIKKRLYIQLSNLVRIYKELLSTFTSTVLVAIAVVFWLPKIEKNCRGMHRQTSTKQKLCDSYASFVLRPRSDATLHTSRIECKWENPLFSLISIRFGSCEARCLNLALASSHMHPWLNIERYGVYHLLIVTRLLSLNSQIFGEKIHCFPWGQPLNACCFSCGANSTWNTAWHNVMAWSNLCCSLVGVSEKSWGCRKTNIFTDVKVV